MRDQKPHLSPNRLVRAAIAFAALLVVSKAQAQSLKGQASVIDGDTIEIQGQRIRLNAIDAPESRQACQDSAGRDYRCGQRAAFALADQIGRATVICRQTDTDRYGRIVATCFARGEDLNRWMVQQGWAIEYKQYSDGRYADAEAEAREAKRGMWIGQFVRPWEWRHGKRE